MERYPGLSAWQKRTRRQQGIGNFTLARYADDFVILTNGTKADAEAMPQEVADFLREKLKLTLSLEKTKVTHLHDGVACLGFWGQRKVGHRGQRGPKVRSLPDAIRRFRGKILEATRGQSKDSVHTKILALARLVGGWWRYYQSTTRARTVFNTLGHVVFKRMTRWLCAKDGISAPEALRRFRHGNTLGTTRRTLRLPSDYRTQVYRESIRKPNPYTARRPVGLRRATLFTVESRWTGFEAMKGQADRRKRLRAEDVCCCHCGSPLTSASAALDHIRPRKQFKRPEDAESFPNHHLLCHACHAQKTPSD
jgi:RNA-directed DNA polymerase